MNYSMKNIYITNISLYNVLSPFRMQAVKALHRFLMLLKKKYFLRFDPFFTLYCSFIYLFFLLLLLPLMCPENVKFSKLSFFFMCPKVSTLFLIVMRNVFVVPIILKTSTFIIDFVYGILNIP